MQQQQHLWDSGTEILAEVNSWAIAQSDTEVEYQYSKSQTLKQVERPHYIVNNTQKLQSC